MLTSRGKTLRAACHRLPSLSNRGLTVIELTVMVGVMIIIALGTSSMFNAGFTTLKHLRMGTDVQSVEQLVSLTLTRPPLSNSPNERVCRTGLNGVSAYTGEKLPNVDIKDAGGRSVLQSLNDKQYTVTAYIDKAISGPVDFRYPDADAGGVLANFRFYLTQIVIEGTKIGQSDMGSSKVQGRVAIGMITRINGAFYDCSVNPTDEKRICEMLGGRLATDPTVIPRCLFTRLPVATHWSRIPPDTLFKQGETYVEKRIFVGDNTTINNGWGGGLQRIDTGIGVGGIGGVDFGMGQDNRGLAGFSARLNGWNTFAMFPAMESGTPWGAGYLALRTYGDRPFIFTNRATEGSASVNAALIAPRQRIFSVNGTITASGMAQAIPYFNGTATSPFRDQVGIAARYSNGVDVGLGGASSDEAYGLFVRTVGLGTNIGAFYAPSNSYPGNTAGALVLKAYNGNDVVFLTKQEPPNVCNGCVPLLLKGNTGNAGIGLDFETPQAKLHIRARDFTINPNAPGLIIDGVSQFNGTVNISRAVNIRRNTAAGLTGAVNVGGLIDNVIAPKIVRGIGGASDGRLKTDIRPIENALERILKLHGVYYHWKDTNRGQGRQIGLLAQNVESVFPELVATDEKGTKSVAYQNLVAPLIEAMRSQKTEIDSLKKDHEQLTETLNIVWNELCLKDPEDSLCREQE